ncbi:MAG: glycosyltransferase family 39 protein [Tepidisphaeraceae bacterium]
MSVLQEVEPARSTARPADPWPVRLIAWGLILVGAAVRLRVYLADRSLWRDEASLALNIIHRSFGGLFRPLDYDQGAPIGFLIIQKLAVTLFGNNEFALRFWPTLASILALPLFYRLSRLLLSRRGALIALAVLALATGRAFYWADNKQYSTDFLLSVGLLLFAAGAFKDSINAPPAGMRNIFPLAVAGILAIWFSHPAIFVLSGIGLAAVVRWFAEKKPRHGAREIVLLAAVWGGSFLANYLFSLRDLTGSEYLQSYWWKIADAFAPLPTSFASLIWYKRNFLEMFQHPFEQELEGLAALAFLLGVVVIYRRRRAVLALLLTPIFAALVASALHQYPFNYRLLLFSVPLTTIVLAAGLDFLCQGQYRLIGILAVALLLISPITQTLNTLISPPPGCEIRDSMQFIAAHRQPGDLFYLYPTAQYGFAYYQPRFGIGGVPVTIGTRHVPTLDDYARELGQFAGKRIWVLFEDPFNGDPVREIQFITQQPTAMDVLDSMGRCLFRDEPFNEYVACYDLSQPPAQAGQWWRAANDKLLQQSPF